MQASHLQRTFVVFLVCSAVVTGSCSVAPVTPSPSRWDEMARENARQWEVLRRIQRRVDWENLGDRITVVPGVGTVQVRDWRLFGAPGKEYVRLFFTYENSTDRQIKQTRIWVKVRDGIGAVRASAWIDIYIPWYEFAPGNTWTGELRVPTRGAHEDRGWSWEVGAIADHGDDSLGGFGRRAFDVEHVTLPTDPQASRRVASSDEPCR
ncbi:MAG: hypothetical protein H6834_13660 [Planctomycetes bacterium]|nr:hypothetical protein [Planctomycetota bacterium]